MHTLGEDTGECNTDDGQCRKNRQPWTNQDADEESSQHTMHEIGPDMATPLPADQVLGDKLDTSESEGVVVSRSGHPQGY